MICRFCKSSHVVKNGNQHGKQAYLCKECRHQWTNPCGKRSFEEEKMAVSLYSVGLSFRTIAALFLVNCSTVMRWIKNFCLIRYSKPHPTGQIEVELDEMYHFVETKKSQFGYGRHIAEQLDNFLTGNLGIEAQAYLKNCMKD